MKLKNKFYGFTLVELIITISILSILSTIGFVSYQSYSRHTRDGARVSSLSVIKGGSELFLTINGTLPVPSSYLTINNYGLQGYVGEDLKKMLSIGGSVTDPYDDSNYIYLTDIKNKKAQFGTFLENQPDFAFVDSLYADDVDFSNRFVYVTGDNIGILVGNKNSPIQQIFTGSLNLSSYTGTLTSYCSNTISITGTGSKLYNEGCSKQIPNNAGNNNCYLGNTFILGGCNL